MSPLTLERYCLECGRLLAPYEVPGHQQAGDLVVRIALLDDQETAAVGLERAA